MRVVPVLGYMGSGKTTLCRALSFQDRTIKYVSTGAIAREIGITEKDKEQILKNGLHPAETQLREMLLESVLSMKRTRIVMLDGFPRTTDQATWLLHVMKAHGFFIDLALLLYTDDWEKRVELRGRGPDDLTIARAQNRNILKTLAYLQCQRSVTIRIVVTSTIPGSKRQAARFLGGHR